MARHALVAVWFATLVLVLIEACGSGACQLQQCWPDEAREREERERALAAIAQRGAELRAEREAAAQAADDARPLPVHTEDDSRARAVRAQPQSPDLGATAVEATRLCESQQGFLREAPLHDGIGYVCELNGSPIFGAHRPANAEALDVVQTIYAGSELPAMRSNIEASLGPAQASGVEEGISFWRWQRKDRHVELSSYDRGVAITVTSLAHK
jgi:hypothetical protein